jgi:hypothetical protein
LSATALPICEPKSAEIKFTDLSIKHLPEGTYFDERTPNFGIRAWKHRKTWIIVAGKNRTKTRLGHYPALSLAEARKRALEAIASPLERYYAPTFPDARAECGLFCATARANGAGLPKTRKWGKIDSYLVNVG